MQSQIDTDTNTVTMTVTIGELLTMDGLGLKVWATPTPQGLANQIYISARPNFREDFVLATVHDFMDQEGWGMLDDEEDDEARAETIMVTVPRARQPLE